MDHRNVKWHKMTASATVSQLHTNAASGLSPRAARSRIRKFGPNTLFDVCGCGRFSVWKPLLTDPSVLLLLFSVFLSVFFSEAAPAIATLISFFSAVILTWILTERIFQFNRIISRYRVPRTLVLRDGRVLEISARGVAPGDILLLQAGDVVPADCRLLEADGEIRTRLVYRDGVGKRVALEQIKRAELVYPYGSTVAAPSCENILYGKSEVLCGTARAVVTEIGAYTYMGAVTEMPSVAAEEQGMLRRSLSELLPFFRLYALFLLILLVPMTVIGLLVSPEGLDAMRTFLPLGILCGLGAQALMLLCFYAIFADGGLRCTATSRADRAVPKSVGALEKLSRVTDLIVLGSSATSDGVMHLYRAALGDGEIDWAGGNGELLAPAAEALELLFRSAAASLSTVQSRCRIADLEDDVLREELLSVSGYDLGILGVRLRRATAYYQGDRLLLEVEYKDSNVRYCFTDREGLLYSCTHYEKDGVLYPLDSVKRAELLRFIESSQSEGARATIVIRQNGDASALVAVLACRERLLQDVSAITEKLSRGGVRVTFFLSEDRESTLHYANTVGLSGNRCRRSQLGEGETLASRFSHDRVYFGFSPREIRDLLHGYRQKGCRFAVLGDEMQASIVQSEAELRVACDPLTDGEAVGIARTADKGSACRALSQRAQLLLPRADGAGGGLSSFLYVCSVARDVRARMMTFWHYLISVHALRIAWIFFTTVLGVGNPTGAQLLWGGAVMDLLSLLWILRMPADRTSERSKSALNAEYALKTVTERRVWLAPILAALALSVCLFVFMQIGLIEGGDAVPYLFFGLLALECYLLFGSVFSGGRLERKRDWLFFTVLLAPPLLLAGLCFALPALNRALELASLSLFGALALPLAPVFYAFSKKIAPRLGTKRRNRK